jgi:hypothetical protein
MEDYSKLTIPKLKDLLKSKGVILKGKPKKQDYIDALIEINHKGGVGEGAGASGAGREQKGSNTLPCLHGSRYLCVAPMPEKYQTKLGATNQGMFYSTGSSNASMNFADVWFPTQGVQLEKTYDASPGWVIKFYSNVFNDVFFGWRKGFCAIVDGKKSKDICTKYDTTIKNCCDLYKNFLDKFSFWYQVTISARLGGAFWDRDDMEILKEYALSYDWDGKKKEFVKAKGDRSPLYVSQESCQDITDLPREEINILMNSWLKDQDAIQNETDQVVFMARKVFML